MKVLAGPPYNGLEDFASLMNLYKNLCSHFGLFVVGARNLKFDDMDDCDLNQLLLINFECPHSQEELFYRCNILFKAVTGVRLMMSDGQKRMVACQYSNLGVLPAKTGFASVRVLPKERILARRLPPIAVNQSIVQVVKKTMSHWYFKRCSYPTLCHVYALGDERTALYDKNLVKILYGKSDQVVSSLDTAEPKSLIEILIRALDTVLEEHSDDICPYVTVPAKVLANLKKKIDQEYFEKPWPCFVANLRWTVLAALRKQEKHAAMRDVLDSLDKVYNGYVDADGNLLRMEEKTPNKPAKKKKKTPRTSATKTAEDDPEAPAPQHDDNIDQKDDMIQYKQRPLWAKVGDYDPVLTDQYHAFDVVEREENQHRHFSYVVFHPNVGKYSTHSLTYQVDFRPAGFGLFTTLIQNFGVTKEGMSLFRQILQNNGDRDDHAFPATGLVYNCDGKKYVPAVSSCGHIWLID